MSRYTLLELVDNVCEKLTSNEYKSLVEEIAKMPNETSLSNTLIYPSIGSDITLIIQLLELGHNYTNVIGFSCQPGKKNDCGHKENYFNLILSHFEVHEISVDVCPIESFPWTFDFTYKSHNCRISIYYSVTTLPEISSDKVILLSSIPDIIPDKYSLLLSGDEANELIDGAEYLLFSHELCWQSSWHFRPDVIIHPWEICYERKKEDSYTKSQVISVSKICPFCRYDDTPDDYPDSYYDD